MIIIDNVDSDNINELCDFLLNVPSINSLDEKILKNGIIARENDEIIGSISFEEYDKAGLIRYFVFKKKLDNAILEDMIDKLISQALSLGIERLVSLADSYPTMHLFKSLDFVAIDSPIYIDEEEIKNTNFKDSVVLSREI